MPDVRGDKAISSADIKARIEELQSLDGMCDVIDIDNDYRKDDAEELNQLKELLAEIGDDRDITLIRDNYFPDYAKEYAEDIGAVGRDIIWPSIDWDEAASELQIDFSTVELDGTTYLYR